MKLHETHPVILEMKEAEVLLPGHMIHYGNLDRQFLAGNTTLN
jgi:hypothetical protein